MLDFCHFPKLTQKATIPFILTFLLKIHDKGHKTIRTPVLFDRTNPRDMNTRLGNDSIVGQWWGSITPFLGPKWVQISNFQEEEA